MCGANPEQAGNRTREQSLGMQNQSGFDIRQNSVGTPETLVAGGYGSMNYDPSTVRAAQKQWINHHSGKAPISDPAKILTLYNIINQRA